MSIILKPTVMELPTIGTIIRRNNRIHGLVTADIATGFPILNVPTPPSFEHCVYELVRESEDEQRCFFCGKELTPNNSTVDHLFAQTYGGPSIYNLRPVPIEVSVEDIANGLVLQEMVRNNIDINSVEPITNCHMACNKCNNMKNSVDEHSFRYAMERLEEGENIHKVKAILVEIEKEQNRFFKAYHFIDENLLNLISEIPSDLIKDNWYNGEKDCKSKKCKRFFKDNGFFKEIVLLDRNLEILSNRMVVRLSKLNGIPTVKAIIVSNVEVKPSAFCGMRLVVGE